MDSDFTTVDTKFQKDKYISGFQDIFFSVYPLRLLKK